ncbi:MAG: indole-3-glycerol phosphate synthase TrpC [Cyanobacteria bacterium P01_D01_bin.105]
MQIRRRPPNPAISVASLEYKIKADDAEPRNILEKIVWHKETEVDRMREKLPLRDLQNQVQDLPQTKGFVKALRTQAEKDSPAIITEVKKASPSKGVIRADFDPVVIAQSYQSGGATCLSVLTDSKFFQGSFDYLSQIRQAVDLPLLCKEFIIYPYQIYKARVAGADAVLLIAAILSDKDLTYFIKIAKTLGLDALVETHTAGEFERVMNIDGVELVGINNRNLEDFTVSLTTTAQLMSTYKEPIAQKQALIVSESGLHTYNDVKTVAAAGAQAILVGESLVKQPDPGSAIARLLGRTTEEVNVTADPQTLSAVNHGS